MLESLFRLQRIIWIFPCRLFARPKLTKSYIPIPQSFTEYIQFCRDPVNTRVLLHLSLPRDPIGLRRTQILFDAFRCCHLNPYVKYTGGSRRSKKRECNPGSFLRTVLSDNFSRCRYPFCFTRSLCFFWSSFQFRPVQIGKIACIFHLVNYGPTNIELLQIQHAAPASYLSVGAVRITRRTDLFICLWVDSTKSPFL